jgi:hypothetical protein
MNLHRRIVTFVLVFAFANCVNAAAAAVTCMQNKSTGKFEEKAVGKRGTTGECDAQNAMTKVVGGVLLTNAPKLSDAVATAQSKAREAREAAENAESEKAAAEKAVAEKAASDKLAIAKANAPTKKLSAIETSSIAKGDTAPLAIPEPVKPVQEWTLTAGHTIGQELQAWGEKTGWKVIWNMPKDWSVPASTSYTGEFPEVAAEVIRTLSANGALVRAQFYNGNKTMVVNGPGVAAQ